MEKVIPEAGSSVAIDKNFVELTDDQMIAVFEGMKEYIGVHEPIFDDLGQIVECRLVKWNRAYSAVRNNVVTRGQSLMKTYYEPLDALQYVNRAWEEGSCEQIFFIGNDVQDKYRNPGEIVFITVVWERVGNLILEMGNDLSDFKQLQLKLQAQEIAVLEAESLATLVEERERVGREMHDSIIQQLYAAALTLRTVSSENLSNDISEQLSVVSGLIENTIIDIREEIMTIKYLPIDDVNLEILELAQSIISGSNASVTVHVQEGLKISSEIAPHFRSVVKEATSNAVRHGHAANIAYSCTEVAGILQVEIADDGVGFSSDFRVGNGLINLRRRAELLGGSFEVLENLPQGTRIKWTASVSVQELFL